MLLALLIVLLGLPATSAHAIPVTSGLVAHYAAEGNANDSSGNGNHGTLVNGATFAPGIVGQGFDVNGATDYIEGPALQERTISMWVNAAIEEQMGFFSGGSTGVNGAALEIGMYKPGGIVFGADATFDTTFGLYVAFWNNDIAIPFDALKSGWHHVAISWDGGTGIGVAIDGAYLDGYLLSNTPNWVSQVQGSEFTLNGAPAPDAAATTLLGTTRHVLHGVGTQDFQGLIDEVAIYDRPLNATEVQSLAAVPEPSSVALLGFGLLGLAWSRRRPPFRQLRRIRTKKI